MIVRKRKPGALGGDKVRAQGQRKGSFPHAARQSAPELRGGEVPSRVTEKEESTQQPLEIHTFKEERTP